MSVNAAELAIRKTIVVEASVEDAFAAFTERIGEWWPLRTHSLGGDDARATIFEARAAGRLYERTSSGDEHDWAQVLICEPPHRLVLEWKVNPAAAATEVEVRFLGEGRRRTRVELEHRGWERRSEDDRQSYDSGWDQVLDRYVQAVDIWTGPRNEGGAR